MTIKARRPRPFVLTTAHKQMRIYHLQNSLERFWSGVVEPNSNTADEKAEFVVMSICRRCFAEFPRVPIALVSSAIDVLEQSIHKPSKSGFHCLRCADASHPGALYDPVD
jgi:hypothetical protein